MADNVNITSEGIKKVLRNYNAKHAIAEYIWNGFDAKATSVQLNFTANELGRIESFEILDNGYGIDFDKLPTKFKPFYESEKAVQITAPKHTSAMHGKNGIGRLSFFTFAHAAEWCTTYRKDANLLGGVIYVSVDKLHTYKEELLNVSSDTNTTSTTVSFYDIQLSEQNFEKEIIPYLVVEFCWFLELNKNKDFEILINGTPLDYTKNIENYIENYEINYQNEDKSIKQSFVVKYIQWKAPLHKEFSKFYFINNQNQEIYKDYTTFNNKGDEFYHSVYIKSEYFNNFDFKNSEIRQQTNAFSKSKYSPEYKFLIKTINEFLRQKRNPVLVESAVKLIDQYEADNILPIYQNEWEEKFKKPQLIEAIKGMYEAQPSLFSNLNIEQKKTFIRFLDLLLDSNEKDNIFKILDGIIEIEPSKRMELAELFKTTRLNCIIDTIKLIQDRYRAYNDLRELVFNPDLKANEVDHVQKLVEDHYWIFGEQYHLVTAAERKFEEALRKYIYLLTENDSTPEIDHPHRLKEMDIFACRRNVLANKIENIVVELKHPNIRLGAKQHSQVYNYLDVILNQQEFNAPNMFWEFYLIGNKFDSSNFIQNQIKTNKPHGQQSLIMSLEDGRVKVFAKTWSEIFAEFEIKHSYLENKLKIERELLYSQYKSADEIIEMSKESSAVQPKEVTIPND